MAKTLTVSVTVQTSGDGENRTFTASQSNANAQPADFQPAGVIAAGGVAGTNGVAIIPPVDSSSTKTLKGISGDTGIPMDARAPLVVFGTTVFIVVQNPLEPTTVIYL